MHGNINDGECNELSCYLKMNFFEEFSKLILINVEILILMFILSTFFVQCLSYLIMCILTMTIIQVEYIVLKVALQ